MKTTLILALVGALVGVIVASVAVPPALAWYTSPGGLTGGAAIPAVVQIPEVIRYATTSLIRGQLIGAAIGAIIGLIIGIMAVRRPRVVVAGVGQTPTNPAL